MLLIQPLIQPFIFNINPCWIKKGWLNQWKVDKIPDVLFLTRLLWCLNSRSFLMKNFRWNKVQRVGWLVQRHGWKISGGIKFKLSSTFISNLITLKFSARVIGSFDPPPLNFNIKILLKNCHYVKKFANANKLTIVNIFILHTLHSNIKLSAIITRRRIIETKNLKWEWKTEKSPLIIQSHI